jgi:hypothetical protein
MEKIIQFGEKVPGYDIRVLNEREIRAAAGIMFLVIYTALMLIIFNGDFRMIKYVIALFLLDFTIRVFINPKYSPTLIIGRLIVSNQVPEYVGAQQKKFAWIIGVLIRLHVCFADHPQCTGCLPVLSVSFVLSFYFLSPHLESVWHVKSIE